MTGPDLFKPQGSLDQRVDALKRITICRPVTSEDELEAVGRLRYRSYLREGAINPRENQALLDRYDRSPSSCNIALYVEGQLSAAIRVSVASRHCPDSPAVSAFPDHLNRCIEDGHVVVDPNRFVVDAEQSRRFPEIAYLAVRIGFIACEHFSATMATATVRREHQAFYRRFLRLTPVCVPRPYPSLIKPLSLMTADYHSNKPKIIERCKFFASCAMERESILGGRLADVA